MVFTEFLDEEAVDKVESAPVSASAKDKKEKSLKKEKEKPMNLNIGVPKDEPMLLLTPKISVIGVGGAGGNAINTMIASDLKGARFLVANTDAQALSLSFADCRIQLGLETTRGLGSGMNPAVGKAAAEEAIDKVIEEIKDSNMLFIAVGMGGGTGTGAAPVIAKAAKELGILTVGVVTKPFNFEGKRRMEIAIKGIEELSKHVDTIIVIPNQNLFRIATEKTSFSDAFKMADNVLYSGVRNITDLIMVPGLINLDFADVCTVIKEMGRAMMGSGEAEGENRALLSAEAAITNQLLDDNSMKGAKGILINITGGMDLSLLEVDAAAERIKSEVDPDANIIIGACLDPSLEGKMRVSVVATGISSKKTIDEPVETMAADTIFGARFGGFTQKAAAPRPAPSPAPLGATTPFTAAKEELSKLFAAASEPALSEGGSVTVGITKENVEVTIDKAEEEPLIEDEPAPSSIIIDDTVEEGGDDDDMPTIGNAQPFGIGTEPIMTIYDDEDRGDVGDMGIGAVPDDYREDIDEPEPEKKSYSGLFKRVTKFTLGRHAKAKAKAAEEQEQEQQVRVSKVAPAAPKRKAEQDVDEGRVTRGSSLGLGIAPATSDTGLGGGEDDLDIPAFLRRH
jgi:cell division protein FtsZ